MTAFFTETTDEMPQVLLIAQQGSFPTAFRAEIQQKNIEVVFFNADFFSHPDQEALVRELEQKYFYKIFWWWGELSEAPVAASQIIEYLLKRGESVTVGASTLQPFHVTIEAFSYWQQLFELQNRNLSYIQEYLSQAQLILTGSLVGEREDYVTRLIYAQLSHPEAVFPDTIFALSTRKEIVSKISAFLFQPSQIHHHLFLQGSQVLASRFVEAFQVKNRRFVQLVSVTKQDIFFKQMTVVPVETPQGERELLHEVKQWTIALPTAPDVKSPTTLSVAFSEQIPVENGVREIPKTGKINQLKNTLHRKSKEREAIVPIAPPTPPVWYPELDAQLEALITRKNPRVVSIFPPVIENRLKRYEIVIQQKIEQQKLRAHLPKSSAQSILLESSVEQTYHERSRESMQSVKALDSQIVKIFGSQRKEAKRSTQTITVQQVSKVALKSKRQTKLIALLGVSLSFLIFAGLISAGFFMNKFLLESSLKSLISNSTYSNSEKLNRAQRLATYADVFSIQSQIWQVILGKDSLKYSAALSEVGREVATSVNLDAEVTQLSKDVWQQVTGTNGGGVTSSLDTMITLIGKTEEVYKKLSLIQAKIQNLEEDDSSNTNKQLISYNDHIQDKRKVLAVSQQFQQLLPVLLGQGGRKTYLIALQNNLELRATGGVIQAAALVTFDNGVLINTQSLNVLEIDRKLSGKAVPPEDLKSLLGGSEWSFRDVSWSGNFPSVAEQLTSYVEKSLGQKVDGVVGLNLTSLQELIKATGPISLPEYQEVVTDKNIKEKVEFHSELAVVDTASPDYLSVLLSREIDQLVQLPPEKTQAVLEAFYNSLKGDQLFLYGNDPGVSSLLDSVGWSGAVLTPNCPTQFTEDSQKCVVDSIFQVDSNIGINRANFFIDRSIQHQIAVSTRQVLHTRLISYQNTAKSNAWPAGAYKNYVRFYLPPTVQNISATINEQRVDPSQIKEFSEGNKKVVGLVIEVPIQQAVLVKLQYDESINQSSPFAYTFFDQKQSGTEADPVQIDVNFEAGLKPVYIAPQATLIDGLIRFNTTQDRHLFVGIKLR